MELRKDAPRVWQLEIGVQTTNTQTLEAIRRKTDLQEIQRITAVINVQGRNVHQHLDLIAGLPYEGMDSFRRSFNDVYAREPEQLQLGFLKVLKGSYMEEMASAYGLTLTHPFLPMKSSPPDGCPMTAFSVTKGSGGYGGGLLQQQAVYLHAESL